ncbi:MAG: DUF983 domain-containing protein [Planctomyces sp.]
MENESDSREMAGESAQRVSPTFGHALIRGIRLRCAMCGRGKMFRDWFRMEKACSCCGFRFGRAPGYFLGSTYINYALTAGLTTVTYVGLHFGLGIANRGLIPALLLFCLVFPLYFFRYARSLWLSLDCCIDVTGASEPFWEHAGSQNGNELKDSSGSRVDIAEPAATLPRSPEPGTNR